MAKDLFNRYIWLVDTIYRARRITFEELNIKWLRTSMSEGKEIPLRTFHNHRQAIEELFDINIDCDKRGGYKYYIDNSEDLEKGGVRNWLINTFAVNNLINESYKLKSRILFEHIPSGQQYLTPIIEAMRDEVNIEITYHGYWREHSSTFEVEPYFVKVFKQRWYLIGRSPNLDQVRIYALDRIQQIYQTENQFKMPKEFVPEEYFLHCFGIINEAEDCPPCIVQLKVSAWQTKYFRSLPLHYSQKEIKTTEEYSIFEYFIQPTFDFKQEILSQGAEVEVLMPESLRLQIQETVQKLHVIYQ